MPQLLANNAYSALVGSLTAGAVSLTVASGTGNRFPSPTGGDYFLLTLADVTGGTESAWEIVKVTARVGDVLTIARAQEGTVARAWAAGTPVDLRITAETLNTKANSASPSCSGTLTHSGDIVLSGTGKRITGDFSNATVANRVMFQTSTGTFSDLGLLAPGAGQSAAWAAYLGNDPTNTSRTRMLATSVDSRFEAGVTGTGTYLPMTFYTGGSERLRIGTVGQLGIAGTNYGTAGQVLVSGGPSAAPSWGAVSGVPTGAVIHTASSTAPTGFLKANGALISRTTYAELFAVIGTTFGGGDGSTTFALPDLRGEFLRGWDDGRGVDVGRVFGSAQADAVKQHTHKISQVGTAGGSGVVSYSNVDYSNEEEPAMGTARVSPTSLGFAAENRPRNVALLACIKF